MTKSTIMEVKNITKQFGNKVVLERISFNVQEGEIFGVIGLSGCGKTTLLSTLVGFIEPDEGEILFRSKEMIDRVSEVALKTLKTNINEVKKSFGFAAQQPSFYPGLTIMENLRHFGAMYGLEPNVLQSNIEQLLSLTGLLDAKNTLAEDLSGGMQKRLDIACAMIHAPIVLILDEPTADLDPLSRRQFWNLIKQINKRGTTIFMSSHFLREIELLCNRIAILHKTNVVIQGTTEELKQLYTKNEEIELESKPGRYSDILAKIKKIRKIDIEKALIRDNRLVIYTSTPEKTLRSLLHVMEKTKEKLIDINVNKPSLNEIFESLVLSKKPKPKKKK